MMKFTLKRLVKPLLLSMAILSANTQVVRAQAENNKGAATSKEQYHAIFHLDSDSPAGMKKILHNIQNLLADPRTKGKVRVELL
ncbi:MAG: hypothetical protein H7333_00200, partial [Bdellovibrionales bacterium]|nr:hypothetical protein [Oligoflexia bacterium]